MTFMLHRQHSDPVLTIEPVLLQRGMDLLVCERCGYDWNEFREGPVHCPVCEVFIADIHEVTP